jgi:hypothetical protein
VLIVANQFQYPDAEDPDNIAETLCDGPFNVSVTGGFATLTFTHIRPDPVPIFREGRVDPKSIVRARIVVSIPNLIALRDLLNRVIQAPDVPAPPAGGPTRH